MREFSRHLVSLNAVSFLWRPLESGISRSDGISFGLRVKGRGPREGFGTHGARVTGAIRPKFEGGDENGYEWPVGLLETARQDRERIGKIKTVITATLPNS